MNSQDRKNYVTSATCLMSSEKGLSCSKDTFYSSVSSASGAGSDNGGSGGGGSDLAVTPPSVRVPESVSPPIARLILAGNPNVGKSVIFGVLTGSYAVVSNYPGTTVEVTKGRMSLKGRLCEVVDTPGVNGLLPMSEDEAVTRDILMTGTPDDSVLMVLDAKNLRRGLGLVLQVAEMGLRIAVDLNMCDEASERGYAIDQKKLATILGVPVAGTVATSKKGTGEIHNIVHRAGYLLPRVDYGPAIEAAVASVQELLPESMEGRRGFALMLLSGDTTLIQWCRDNMNGAKRAQLKEIIRNLSSSSESVQALIRKCRLALVDSICAQVVKRVPASRRYFGHKFGNIAMHPIWGVPIMLAVLALIYFLVGHLAAGVAVDWLQVNVFERIVNPATLWIVELFTGSSGTVHDFLVGATGNGVAVGDGAGLLVGDYGLVSMGLNYALAIVLPIVGAFFLAFSLMEDSGYLPRLSVVANRAFKVIGLNGRAILPMVLGLGCGTMATVTARIMPTRKERLLVTFLLALAVPCSAQLGVIMGMLGSVSLSGILVWSGAVLGMLILSGLVASRVVPGEVSDFVMEIPPLRKPALRNVVIKTVARMEWFLKEAVPIFLLGTLFLWGLDRTGLIVAVRDLAAPVIQGLLGLPAAATDAFVIGFLRRDYGAAGLFELSKSGVLDHTQLVVSMVSMTLFVPCIAQMLMIIKERGLFSAVGITAIVTILALSAGVLVKLIMGAI